MTGSQVEIAGRTVGSPHACFVVAEIGVNHNGDLGLARRLVEAASRVGADAVKFQTFRPELLAAEGAPRAEYQKTAASRMDGGQLAMLSRLALSESDHRELQRMAGELGLVFLSSVFDEISVDLLESLDVAAYKVPSGEVTNHPLLRKIAATGRAVLMSTGMCTVEEVDEAVALLDRCPLVLLHCVSSYPAAPADCNLRAMELLAERYRVPIGWSDHTSGTAVAIAAVALGAVVVEKHLTLSRRMEGPDHRASLEPRDFVRLVEGVRQAEASLGQREKRPSLAEREIARVVRKSLHWRIRCAPGHIVTRGDLVALRPGTGIGPARLDEIVGRRLLRPALPGTPVSEADLE